MRTVPTIRTKPVDRLDTDRAAMLPLPRLHPGVVGWVNGVRLGRAYYASRSTTASTPFALRRSAGSST